MAAAKTIHAPGGLFARLPLAVRSFVSGQLFSPQCRLTDPHPDILFERNVSVEVSDGFTLTANVFRSRTAAETGVACPVVMCATPYSNQLLPLLGKTPFDGPAQQYWTIPQSGGAPIVSKLTSWESPDPNFWVPNGYAVVNLNLPGYGGSEAPPTVCTDSQAKAFYEAIQWVAAQSWCSGKVGLNGVGFLALSQLHVAACRHYNGPPAALKCIAPWESPADLYREIFCPGGVDEVGFPAFWWASQLKPALSAPVGVFLAANGSRPDDFIARHQALDAFWEEKAPDLEKIGLPMLLCGSFSDHGLDSVGSFRAFTQARSKQKWLYTHRSGKWSTFYSAEVQALTKAFMDCFLKGDTSSGFQDFSPVRLEVRSGRDFVHEVREESEWPIRRAQYRTFYLHAEPNILSELAAAAPSSAEHSAANGRAVFALKFEAGTEITGPMKLRLWVEARGSASNPPDDMVLFVAINKRGRNGRSVPFYGSLGNSDDMVSRGFCRVARRELDYVRSKPWQPVLTGTSNNLLAPGEIVDVEIELYPSSTYFFPEETLELIISSSEIIPSLPYLKDVSCNRGTHVLHTGGKYDAHLLLPFIPTRRL